MNSDNIIIWRSKMKYKCIYSASINFVTLTSCWNPWTGTLGAWWLRTDRQASIRCIAQISRDILLSSTPSSVVRGELSYRDFRTRNGKVGRELAIGEVKMWPARESRSPFNVCFFLWKIDMKRSYIKICSRHWSSIRNAYPHLHHLWPPTQASEGTALSFSPSEEHLHIQAVAKTNQRQPGNEGEWLA